MAATDWFIRDSRHLDFAMRGDTMLLASYCGSLAWFDVKATGEHTLHVARAPSISTERFNHTALHAFLPNALTCWGMPMLHAACVVVDGRAVLLSGPSSAGKSTLAAGFLRRGDAVLSDDVIRVERDGAGFVAYPSYGGARLRSGSFLLDGTPRRGRANKFGLPKFRIGTDVAVPQERFPVAAMLFLGHSRSPRPTLEPLAGGELMNEWLDASFVQALPRDRFARDAFTLVGGFARGIPAWRLRYKRSVRHFDGLLDGIVELVRVLPLRS
ncbi:MAG: hypothetical protein JSS05_09965 [Proteobacteria bacterium]|nr:hypothetical protein [Pseudomonadota bacterium]